jgi:hypothetical protein
MRGQKRVQDCMEGMVQEEQEPGESIVLLHLFTC